MQVKTYGINGLSEWHGKVKTGSIEVNVSFTGGTASPSGALPAYMVSRDPITQFVVENSKEFKDGFIKLILSQDIPGTHPRVASHSKKAEKNSDNNTDTSIKAFPEVTRTQDAKNILKDLYNYDVENIRSKAQAHEAARSVGISFPHLQ